MSKPPSPPRIIDLTGGVIRVTLNGGGDTTDLREAGELDVALHVVALEGAGGPTAVVELWTADEEQRPDGWILAFAFRSVIAGTRELQRSSVARFVRWNAKLTGAAPALEFSLAGALR